MNEGFNGLLPKKVICFLSELNNVLNKLVEWMIYWLSCIDSILPSPTSVKMYVIERVNENSLMYSIYVDIFNFENLTSVVHTAAFSKTNLQSLNEKNCSDVWLPVIHMLNPSNLRPTMWRFLTFPGMSGADRLQMLALRNQSWQWQLDYTLHRSTPWRSKYTKE